MEALIAIIKSAPGYVLAIPALTTFFQALTVIVFLFLCLLLAKVLLIRASRDPNLSLPKD